MCAYKERMNETINKNYMHILIIILWTQMKCSSVNIANIKYNSVITDVQMDASTEGHVDCTWTWWSSDRCPTEELEGAHEHTSWFRWMLYRGTCKCM